MKTFTYWIFIFLLRALDVSVGSIRTIFLIKEKTILAAIFSFIEVVIWLLVTSKIFKSFNLINIIFYAFGYSFGTLIGILINKRYIDKNISVMITSRESIIDKIKKYNPIIINANNDYIYLIILNKKDLNDIKFICKETNSFILVSS